MKNWIVRIPNQGAPLLEGGDHMLVQADEMHHVNDGHGVSFWRGEALVAYFPNIVYAHEALPESPLYVVTETAA